MSAGILAVKHDAPIVIALTGGNMLSDAIVDVKAHRQVSLTPAFIRCSCLAALTIWKAAYASTPIRFYDYKELVGPSEANWRSTSVSK
jgi:hypothetical protein